MQITRTTRFALGALTIVAPLLVATSAHAAAKSGATCTKVGATEGTLQCKQVGKAKRWVTVSTPTTAPATTAPATTAPAVTTPAPAGFPLTGDSQGVTDTTVKIGIIAVVNRGGSSAVSTAVGDERAQIAAIVDSINDSGGIAGRKVIPVIKEMNVAGNTFAQSPVICASLADDEKVFAVILQGHSFVFERECYTKKKVMVIDPSNVSFEDSVYKKLAPFLFATSTPTYDRWIPALMTEAKDAGYFKDAKVGIFALDTPDDRRLIEGLAAKELAKVGITNFEVGYSGFDSPVTFFRDAAKAIGRFQAAGVNRVILMGQQGLGVAFVLTAEQMKFAPRYLLHSNEVPRYLSDIPRGPGLQPLQPGTLSGAMGIGWTPYQDADDVHNSFPQPGAEAACIGSMRARGIAFGSRNLARYAIGVCDGLSFLQAAGKPLKSLNVQAVAASAEKLGTSWKAPGAYKTNFSGGRHDGGGGYRLLIWDESCRRTADANGNIGAPPSGGCWNLGSTVKDF